MSDDLKVLDASPRQVEGIVMRFNPTRGILADFFPDETVLTDEAILIAKQHPGVMWVEGQAKVGVRVRFTVANGEALYELTGRADVAGKPGYFAKRLLSE